jgi:hypothetical protein
LPTRVPQVINIPHDFKQFMPLDEIPGFRVIKAWKLKGPKGEELDAYSMSLGARQALGIKALTRGFAYLGGTAVESQQDDVVTFMEKCAAYLDGSAVESRMDYMATFREGCLSAAFGAAAVHHGVHVASAASYAASHGSAVASGATASNWWSAFPVTSFLGPPSGMWAGKSQPVSVPA